MSGIVALSRRCVNYRFRIIGLILKTEINTNTTKMEVEKEVAARIQLQEEKTLAQCGAALVWELRNNRKFSRMIKGTQLEKRLETIFANEPQISYIDPEAQEGNVGETAQPNE